MKKIFNLKYSYLMVCMQLLFISLVSVQAQTPTWEKIRDYKANNTSSNSPQFVDVVTDSKGLLYAATRENVFLWNGTDWSTFATVSGDKHINTQGSVSGNLEITAISVDGANNVYVCGLFNKINNVATRHIAKWNAVLKKWEAYPSLMFAEYSEGKKYDIEMQFSGLTIINNALHANSHYGHLYKYENNAWKRISIDTSDTAILPNGFLVKDASNNMYNTDPTKTNVVKWNTAISKWTNLGDAFGGGNGVKRTIVGKDGTLYAYGHITKVGSKDINYIAKWNGTQWVNVAGLQNLIDVDMLQGCGAMAFDQNNTMYVGITPRQGMSKVYQLNGTQWSAFETGLNANDEECTLMTFDPINSYLYAFCSNGIYRCSTKSLKPASVPTKATPTTPTTPALSARTYNGAPSVVELPQTITTAISSQSALTIEYWFKGTQLQSAFRLQGGNNFIVAGWGGVDPVHLFSNEGFDKTLKIKTKTGGSVQDNQWHHIAVTWSKGVANGFVSYVDGELIEAKNAVNAPLPTFTNTKPALGAFVNGTNKTELTNGQLARVRVWKVARTPQEIKDNKDKDLPANTANMLYQGNGN